MTHEHEHDATRDDYNQSRLSSFMRIINNAQNLSHEARKATGRKGHKLFRFVLDQRGGFIDTYYPENSPERTMELGRSALILTAAQGEDWRDVQDKALAFGMDPYKDLKVWLKDGLRDGARHYDERFKAGDFAVAPIETDSAANEPGTSSEQHAAGSNAYLMDSLVRPVEDGDLHNTIVDLLENGNIRSPIVAGGMMVLFELQTPRADKPEQTINDTLYATTRFIGDRLIKLSPAKDAHASVKVLKSIINDTEAPTIDSAWVSRYAKLIESQFDSYEDARHHVESHIAAALNIVFQPTEQATGTNRRRK